MATINSPGSVGGVTNLAMPQQGVPFVNQDNGLITRQWWMFLINLYNRVGGSNAPSNTTINNVVNNLQNSITAPVSEDYFTDENMIPGPIGPQGAQGIQGLTGPALFYVQDEVPDVESDIMSWFNSNVINRVPQPFLTNTSGSIGLTTDVAANTASVTLTPGVWDVQCNIIYTPAATTVMGSAWASLNTVSATLNTNPGFTTSIQVTHAANVGEFMTSPMQRFTVSSNTTVFAVALSHFSTSTCTAQGIINATLRN